jgi:pSer/pThr/pTyr-binding forkhead associated (FHA) protein
MKKVTLRIENLRESLTRTLDEELSIGRTPLANVVLDDEGLSRVNTTIFRDGDDVLIVDENSTNGTYINGEQISGAPKRLKAGDEITIGNHTKIFVEIRDEQSGYEPLSTVSTPTTKPKDKKEKPIVTPPTEPKNIPTILIAAVGAMVLIIIGAVAAILLIPKPGETPGNSKSSTPIVINSDLVIPKRVIDPLGGQDPDDLDDFIASWENEEDPLKAEDIEEIKTTTTIVAGDTPPPPDMDLKVKVEFWQQQLNKALNHPGSDEQLRQPPEMGGGVRKQSAKLQELINQGYKQPMDFADLAELRLNKVLVELPIATNYYVLDVGGSAGTEEFKSFDWDTGPAPLSSGSPKYEILKRLADNFDGEKYDLNNPTHRKQMRMRLLRMYNPGSRPILKKICEAFYQKFNVPLRITSLLRSMDYQISLNKTNSNSFRAGKGSLPPHTSGCAFDLSRKNLHGSEQNFIMEQFALLEQTSAGDSIIEGGANSCFHTFIFPDGRPPGSAPSKPPPTASPNAKPSPKAKPTGAGKR